SFPAGLNHNRRHLCTRTRTSASKAKLTRTDNRSGRRQTTGASSTRVASEKCGKKSSRMVRKTRRMTSRTPSMSTRVRVADSSYAARPSRLGWRGLRWRDRCELNAATLGFRRVFNRLHLTLETRNFRSLCTVAAGEEHRRPEDDKPDRHCCGILTSLLIL